MGAYQLLLFVQYITIAVLFAECALLLAHWRNKTHNALFLYCVAALVNDIGYTGVMRAATEREALICQQFSYLGRVWIPYALLLFVMYYCKRLNRKNRGILALMAIPHLLVYVLILTVRHHSLYYTDIGFTQEGLFPHLLYGYGPVHHLFNLLILGYAFFGLYHLFRKYRADRTSDVGRGTIFVGAAILADLLFFILEILGVGEAFDMMVLGYASSSVFLYIALTRYDLLDTRTLAQDFVLDHLTEAIIAVDQNGITGFFNEPAEKLFPELVSDPAKALVEIRNYALEGEVFERGDRKYLPECHVLRQNDKEVGTAYVFSDDTDHLQYMEELEKQKALADSANRAKSAFLANMSHDIRTPLNAVLGMDEMILRESSEKTVLAYAADIRSAGRTLLSLINDILDFSKIEEGKLEILPVQYELSSMIFDLVNLIRERAAKKGLIFRLSVDEHIPHLLLGDEVRIRQCVMNLLTNAVKYTHEGSVDLTVGFEPDGEDAILLRFEVRDTGIGIKDEDRKDLFSPFIRIEEKRNRNIEGTGLGISIVRDLLGMMGSTLEVSSEYGKGSVFGFALRQTICSPEPVGRIAERFPARGETEDYHAGFTAPDARILVVDDTEVNLQVIRNLLKQTALQIDTASSGREALSMAATHTYDCILLDHMMPDMDGIETLQEMKKLPGMEHTTFIALTANAISGARERYLNAGFNDYLSKPVDAARLEKLLERYLPKEKCRPYEGEQPGAKDAPTGREQVPVTGDEEKIHESIRHLRSMDGLSVDQGITNCGSGESLLSVLRVFHDTGEAKAKEIEQYYAQEDWANYTVKVHALKSSARIIGAQELSDLARTLEEAGKAGNLATIRERTAELLEDYRRLNGQLDLLNAKEQAPEEAAQSTGEAEVQDAKEALLEASEMMDYGLAEGILKELGGRNLTGQDRAFFEKVKERLLELDWDGITELLKK
ncbi:MAG: response regulator [Lachnospiraceae bacterium]|nr:response regulator [Lachnospiraceae bacterium]